MSLDVSSPAFGEGESMPSRFTCDGENVSPPLAWRGVPDGAAALAVIVDDPDAPAGTWVHWVLYGLDPGTSELPEGVPARDTVLGGARQGRNDFEDIGYGGPCPPGGQEHRYRFEVYALDAVPGLAPGATKADLLEAMEDHVLAEGRLTGTYRRR
ncbi:MAG TPA: YbhB/YbcL family Raf kinase inhibitor-like protein [Gemmatimonadota bacterium]|nr:YbhB/YbcL family Raf kinase inhibitor-like protein [Gemmatimonadota bacterium]